MRCITCKTGTIVDHGSYRICNNCNYSKFTVDINYAEACGKLLGALVSNLTFNDEEAFAEYAMECITHHLPMLQIHIKQLVKGREELLNQLFDAMRANTINLEVGGKTLNESTPELTCCGKHDFVPYDGKISELLCVYCNAKWIYEDGIYQPEFVCECGCFKYTDLGAGLISCTSCNKGYIYNAVIGAFLDV